ncbi:MAG: DsrE/DsrF/DrsH-like family protein [Dysgonamonadaceae bacterium]|jgi:peroxiredoxin family protein|nr:DsrE/DsrF/DrsH-like family protein [Dysgonamonadaceae bacterium]MDD3355334.1 DsrE/DsrF/DrsH-like family protein [Dysgonamonadaceae bacterium]MDD3726726.1 DsrE/DsrF/DrsH-like family protein [Dysgonamonadaceae bacterium]MDD4245571.1 DsrE/DsrF/DrsH-like family protein [Dysgonamonadaceae bacterium]MDD4605270.1 DsrE/DsrF/DrsH-like family protein [Dysgonamonadaceae bacterium]
MENLKEITMEKLLTELKTLKAKTDDMEDSRKDQLSIAIISGDMDKIMATMIVALAAAAMDSQVKLFFSFWAIGALRDPKKQGKGKNFISKMFGMMLPKGRNKLKLSKFNMLGMGPLMMKGLMKQQNVLSLDEMFKQAGELGIEITVCEMTMNLMGFKKEEMIDYPHLSYAGATTFIVDAGESSMQWMI